MTLMQSHQSYCDYGNDGDDYDGNDGDYAVLHLTSINFQTCIFEHMNCDTFFMSYLIRIQQPIS